MYVETIVRESRKSQLTFFPSPSVNCRAGYFIALSFIFPVKSNKFFDNFTASFLSNLKKYIYLHKPFLQSHIPPLIILFLLQQMREAAERRKDLEREHADTLTQLRDKQAEVCVALARSLAKTNRFNLPQVEKLTCAFYRLQVQRQHPVKQMTSEPSPGTSRKGYESVEALQVQCVRFSTTF